MSLPPGIEGKKTVGNAAGENRPNLPADTEAFLKVLDEVTCRSSPSSSNDVEAARGLFCLGGGKIAVTRAPGRLDVLGGISDYSGSLVLQQTTAEACHAAVQIRPPSLGSEASCSIVSFHADGEHRMPRFQCPMASLFPDGKPLPYSMARDFFKADAKTSWAAYVAGCLLVLAHERGLNKECNQDVAILVSSDVPEGKGVSSSAAIEVSTMKAILSALDIEMPGRDMALLCVKVENLVVGAPCGTMDQITSALGNAKELLALLCQPAELQPAVTIPDSVRFWGVDSGERHSVGGADYGSVRIGAFMGLRIATHAALVLRRKTGSWAASQGLGALGCKQKKTEASVQGGEEMQWPEPICGGYLANLTPSAWMQWVEESLPEHMLGADFLQQYGSHYDEAITQVDPGTRYAVRRPTLHPIFESHRVSVFRQVLSGPENSDQLPLLGELIRQSHESYGRCKLGSPGTDRLVQLVQEHVDSAGACGRQPHLFGAKITGGGSGGTVCILGEATDAAEAALQDVLQIYASEKNLPSLQVFRGSSMGAMAFGHVSVV